MADYVGTYTNDFGVLFKLSRVSVYAVVDGVRSATQEDTDLTFLPPVFVNAVTQNFRGACEIASGSRRIRHARAWFRADGYLHIPCLWRGDAPEFNQFHQALIDNPEILRIDYVGERVNAWYTQVFSG